MNLNNYYYYYKSALSSYLCDRIIQLGLQQTKQQALTGGFGDRDLTKQPLKKKELSTLKKKRNSHITWLEHPWIYSELGPYIHEANEKAGWNFQWDWSEPCQFTKYKLNQHYDWHCDSWTEPYNTPDNLGFHGKIRKLSVALSLSDPKDYKGGDFEFDFRNKDPDKKRHVVKCKELKTKGSIVIFPSFVWHRVKPVTKGKRYSLVMWNLGHPFK
jgi:PKHD-type hydroxylase|tara:strand:- start:5698 stop:6339 length:642 start_codon:yes stop_codon:yes gene_type:complete